MRKNNLAKLYPNLTPDERFKLLLTALARGDEDDAHDIAHSCPKKSYLISDPAYADRLEAGRDIAIFYSLEWLLQEQRFSVSSVILTMNSFARNSYLTGYLLGCGKQVDINKVVDKADELATSHTQDVQQEYTTMHEQSKRQLKALLLALEEFCHDIDVPIEHMFYWFPPTIEWINDKKAELQDVQPDDEAMNCYLSLLQGCWTERTGETIAV
ncbi:hypothetical protein SPSYN_03023 [Sporotomaculum syntrophicum]|uniref:Uncharacterized protein n=1 Tax=Sporotomaculum syntrophicum TaxID=182264 RepID=A0A9D2WLX3_9FIRM|nr:hypothetical protein [Sporotomaculum syntrophicum]KAF1083867.1 hypothetical protein SPSYN_03023 [Sporotomaculum syntrophicum]